MSMGGSVTKIEYAPLTGDNFHAASLDGFVRRQEVEACWRRQDGRLTLVPCRFTEDWDAAALRLTAQSVLRGMAQGFAFGAFAGTQVIGFAMASGKTFGSRGQYMELRMLQVSQPFRRQGIGRALFSLVCEEARKLGAERLYISAHSSRESQAAYRRLGCTEAEEINRAIADTEPFDIQMEYRL